LDSGNIVLEVSVPCIGGTFHSGRNFYSRQEGQLDYTAAAAMVIDEGERALTRVESINEVVENPKLEQARNKLESAVSLDPHENDTEKSQEAMEKVLEAKRLLAQVRHEHRRQIRQIDLGMVLSFFDECVRKHARPSETTAFDNLVKTAQRSIDQNDNDFESHLDDLKGKNFDILWRQDWFVVERFKSMAGAPHRFADRQRFETLVRTGKQFMQNDEIDKLRTVVGQLYMIQIGGASDNDIYENANIIRG
jgi:molecular chaperone DnaK